MLRGCYNVIRTLWLRLLVYFSACRMTSAAKLHSKLYKINHIPNIVQILYPTKLQTMPHNHTTTPTKPHAHKATHPHKATQSHTKPHKATQSKNGPFHG